MTVAVKLISGAQLTDLLQICFELQAGERAQWEAMTGTPYDPQQCALQLANHQGFKWTIYADGAPIAAGGFVPLRPGVWQDWMVTNPAVWAPKNWRSVTKIVKRVMDAMLDGEAHRLQCVSMADRIQAHKWYSVLGLEAEATLHGYGANGEHAIMFRRLRA
jgi:hypothetical protein